MAIASNRVLTCDRCGHSVSQSKLSDYLDEDFPIGWRIELISFDPIAYQMLCPNHTIFKSISIVDINQQIEC